MKAFLALFVPCGIQKRNIMVEYGMAAGESPKSRQSQSSSESLPALSPFPERVCFKKNG